MKEEDKFLDKSTAVITNIQRMCMNDGPGIRTTVFFKGCSLACPWCANPENILFEKEYYEKDMYSKGIYGTDYNGKQLYEELMKDWEFWRNTGGGVTFSGGEPLLHLYKIESVLQKLKEKKVHLAVETALFVPSEFLLNALEWIDYFIADIKILDGQLCRQLLNGDINIYLENLDILKRSKRPEQELLFRIPCNSEYTVSADNLKQICSLLKEFQGIPVEIFAVHSMGKSKYESMGKPYREFDQLSVSQLNAVKHILEEYTESPVMIQNI